MGYPKVKRIPAVFNIFAAYYLQMGFIQRDSLKITIIAYLGAAIGYLNKVFLFTNFLETDQVGLANLLITLATIYAQFASLGTFNIIYKFFPFFNDREKHHHGFLFGTSAIAFAGFILSTLIFILLRQPFRLLYAESSPMLVEYSFYLLPLALATLYYQIFDSYLRSLYKNVFPSLVYEVFLRLFITLSVSVFALGWIDFKQFVSFYVIANCLPTLLIFFYTWYIGQMAFKPLFSPLWRRAIKIIVVYGIFTLLNNLSYLVLSSIDSLMVARMIDLSAAGIYTTMIFVTSVLLIPYRSIAKVAAPVVAGYWKTRSFDDMEDLYKRSSGSNLVIGSGLFLLLWVNIDSLLYFLPDEYAAGKYVFLMLGIGRIFDMASGINGVILLTSKKYRYDLLFTLGLVVLAIITNYIFIPVFGMNGAAFASMISLIFFNLLRIIFIQVQFRLQPFHQKQVWFPFIVLTVLLVSGTIEQIMNVYVDVLIRSSVISLLYIVPVYYLKISEDVNQMIHDYKSGVFRFMKK